MYAFNFQCSFKMRKKLNMESITKKRNYNIDIFIKTNKRTRSVRLTEGFTGATERGACEPLRNKRRFASFILNINKNIDIIKHFWGILTTFNLLFFFERTLKIECIYDFLVILTTFNFFITLNA